MQATLRIILVLTLTCFICSFLLAFTYSLAQQKISQNEKAAVERSIFNLAPQTSQIKDIPHCGEPVYALYGSGDSLSGYAFMAEGQGYQGTIKLLAVSDTALSKLMGIEIIESVETPGLGAEITKAPFLNQFKGLNITAEINLVKKEPVESSQIKAITGATISSRAVVNILNRQIAKIKACLK